MTGILLPLPKVTRGAFTIHTGALIRVFKALLITPLINNFDCFYPTK